MIIHVLNRSNGFIGIYVGGDRQENLVSNFPSTMPSEFLFKQVAREVQAQAANGVECSVVFTEDEEKFKSGLASLGDYLRGQ